MYGLLDDIWYWIYVYVYVYVYVSMVYLPRNASMKVPPYRSVYIFVKVIQSPTQNNPGTANSNDCITSAFIETNPTSSGVTITAPLSISSPWCTGEYNVTYRVYPRGTGSSSDTTGLFSIRPVSSLSPWW